MKKPKTGNGAGLVGDKWNVAVGYKFSFKVLR